MDYKKSLFALSSLEKIDKTKENSYQEIYKIISEQVIIPYTTFPIPSGSVIFRARTNEGHSFNLKKQISYNHNRDSISIGRANYYRQPIFYASFMPETAIFETSNTIKKLKNEKTEVITVGKWLVNKPIDVIPIFHDDEFLQKNDFLRDGYLTHLANNPLFTEVWAQEHLKIISKHFAKKIECVEDYKISCAFFNVMRERRFTDGGISGILFPTVEWEKNDINIALTAECVEKHLSLTQVSEFTITLDENGWNDQIIQTGTSDCVKYKINKLAL